VSGSGVIDGQGSQWWDIRRQDPSKDAPKLFQVQGGQNLTITNIRLQNSPMYHITLKSTKDVLVHNVTIYSPADAPNTDGIDPGDATDITIRNCSVDTGDDNIAIKSNSTNILVEDCYFASGHGSSIGSIGEDNSYGYVENVTMRNIVFNGTTNCARVKTWQGGTGYVKNITFSGLTLINVENPIIIDQYYCPSSQHPGPCSNSSKAVAVSEINIIQVKGTQTKGYAGSFNCSDAIPCQKIYLQDISISGHAPNLFQCWKAYGSSSNVVPASCLHA